MNKLMRSSTNKSLYGVCAGIAEFFGISPFIVRVIFIVTSPISIWVYLILVNSLTEKPSIGKFK